MALVFGSTMSATGAATARATTTQTISRVVTIPAVPLSSFAGVAGGDGFNAAVGDGRVYNVFHHQETFQASCLQQSDGTSCGDGWPYTSDLSDEIGTPMSSYAFLSTDGDRLYAYGLIAGESAGVMCVTLPDPSSCGYTPLTAVSGTPIPITGEDGYGDRSPFSMDFGAQARVADRIYAPFADASGVWLSCFDLGTGAPCAGAPYALGEVGGGWQQDSYLRGPRAVAYGERVYVTLHDGSGPPSSTILTCWDPAEQGTCGEEASAVWPVDAATPWGLVPALSTDGEIASVCLIDGGVVNCVDALSGTPASAPAVLSSYAPESGDSGAFAGQARIIGTRMVFISSTSPENPRFTCIDFGSETAAWCGDFSPANAELMYAVDADPDRPGCLWFNSDHGSGQIQSFDMLTMTSGCSEQGRIARPQIAPDIDSCPVYSWSSVQVLAPDSWTTGSLDVRTTEGERSLPGGSGLSLVDTATPTSLALIDVSGETSPLFVFSFTGASLTAGVTARFTWVTDGADSCSASTSPGTPEEELAATGPETQGMIALGLALSVLGATALASAWATGRRRRGRVVLG